MEPIWKFQHLDIARCFPTDDETWWRYEPLVPAHARQGLVAPSNAHAEMMPTKATQINAYATGVLYMCVLNLPLFQCDKDHPQHVRDVRIDLTHQKQRYFPSQDHLQLIERIVFLLRFYEEHVAEHWKDAFAEMDHYAAMLKQLHRRRKTTLRWHTTRVPGRKTTRRWSARIPPAARFRPHELYLSLLQVETFNLDWYLHYGTYNIVERLKTTILEQLYETFVQYGPLPTRTHPQYSSAALYAAIYAILAAFGLEKPDDCDRGADRVGYAVKKYRQQKNPSPSRG